MNDQDIEIQEVRGDFYLMLRDAIEKAGGTPALVDRIYRTPLHQVVDVLAQNGIRMVYLPNKTLLSDRCK